MGERADFLNASTNTTRAHHDAELGNRRDFDAQSNPDVIAQDIEQTRDEMSETIDAIQGRLEPEQLSAQAKEVAHYAIDEAKGAVRELAGQASAAVREATVGRVEQMATSTRDSAQYVKNDLYTTIKENPVPAALAAVGIGWLWSKRASGSGYASRSGIAGDWNTPPYYGAYGVDSGEQQRLDAQARQKAGQVAHQAGEVAHQVQERFGQVQQTAGQMPVKAQGFWEMVESNPIALGALGLAIGGIAGMAVPETEQERQLMGETRDRVIGNVQQVAGETMDKVQRVAAEAGQTIDTVKSAAAEAGNVVMDEAQSQGVVGKSGS